MNRFVKNNIFLVISIAATSVVALGLLVYGVIEWVRISGLMEETESLRNKIDSIIKARPAPVDANKPLIKQDTEFYAKLYKEITPAFNSPMKEASADFLRVLYSLKATDNIEEARQKFLDTYNEHVRSDMGIVEQRMAWEKLRLSFKNWDAAVDAFCRAAAKVNSDPSLNFAKNDVVLEEMGVARRMNEDSDEVQRFLINIRTFLRNRLGDRLAAGDNFGFDLATPYPKSDYPLIARHAGILCDLIGRIADSKIELFNGIVIRGAAAGSLGSSFSEESGCQVAHYTFEVNGSLESIRDLAKRFDNARQDKRFYIVRSVFLYGPEAERNVIQSLVAPKVRDINEEGEGNPAADNSSIFGGGRRERLARQRMLEEQERASEAEKAKAAEEEARRQRELSLQPHEREGYGGVKLGEVSQFKAVFDIDYIERR